MAYNDFMNSGEHSRSTGEMGEALVSHYLAEQGYVIICRNYAIPGVGEVDIIAHHEGVLHFVEVKASESYRIRQAYHAAAHFDLAKKDRVARVMRKYCDDNDITIPRTVSLASIFFSRETCTAEILFEPFILLDTV